MNIRPVVLLQPSYDKPDSVLIDCSVCGVVVETRLDLSIRALLAQHDHADIRRRQFTALNGSTA